MKLKRSLNKINNNYKIKVKMHILLLVIMKILKNFNY